MCIGKREYIRVADMVVYSLMSIKTHGRGKQEIFIHSLSSSIYPSGLRQWRSPETITLILLPTLCYATSQCLYSAPRAQREYPCVSGSINFDKIKRWTAPSREPSILSYLCIHCGDLSLATTSITNALCVKFERVLFRGFIVCVKCNNWKKVGKRCEYNE